MSILLVMIIGSIMMLIIGLGIVGYLYVNQSTTPAPAPSGTITVQAGKIEATGSSGTSEIELQKVVGETTEGVVVDPNVLSLVTQTSIDECKRDTNYGLVDEETMYASDGCRGMFTYKDQVGMCGSVSGNKSECPIGKYKIDKSLKLAGLVKTDLKMIKDHSDGKCVDGTWGQIDYNNIYAKNGCKGLFQYGTLFGYCSSHKDEDGSYKESICKIGKTEPDNEFETGDAVRMKNVGLRIQSPDLKGDVQNQKSCVPYDSNDNIYYNISPDSTILNTWNGCSSEFNWGPYKGSCNSNTEKQECPIGSTIESNDIEIGLPVSNSY